MQGKVVVATGATSGVGAVAVEALAAQGARVLFVARDPRRAEATLRRLEAAGPGLGHKAVFADLSLMAQTKRAGAEIAREVPRVDVLINNAGAVFSGRQVTAEGLERTFALNHMSYFVLTRALRETLGPGARVVSTSSGAHRGVALDFDQLQGERGFSGWRAYGRSKLCNILFTRELARRAPEIAATCLHPGVVATRFADDAGGWMAPAFGLAKRLFAITPEQGADTIVWLAAAPEAAGLSGQYVYKRRVAPTSSAARDDGAAARLWEVSEKLAASAT